MSSDLQSELEVIQLNDYVSVAMVSAVTYDYFLTISREIDYIWYRRWTWVSTMFLLVRYIGLCWAILNGLGTVLLLVIYWGFPVFLAAADMVMILRVYAMWNRSRWILVILLLIYVPQVIISFVLAGIYYNPNKSFSVSVAQVMDDSFCSGLSTIATPLQLGVSIPRFVLGAILLVLAIIPALKQSVELYKATKVWQSNKNMQKLMEQGILYFLVNALYNTHDVIVNGSTINTDSSIFLALFSYIAICTIMPRFIISVRELYDDGARRHWQNVDTGFGLLSRTTSEKANTSAVVLTDFTLGRSQTAEGYEYVAGEMTLKALDDKAYQV